MTIDCSLDNFRYPGLPTYGINFGVKKTSGEGLSTAECCDDMAMPFNRQRPYIVTETSETTDLEANSVFKITASDITLTVEDAVFDGCTALIVNNSTGTVTIKGGVSGLDGSTAGVKLHKGQFLSLIFCSGWITSGGSAANFLLAHPVGSYWWTQDNTDPNEAYGGTWVRVKDKFVLAAGDTYSGGNTGGNSSITISTNQLPSHTHSFTPVGTVAGHTHGLNNHTHTFTPSGTVASHSHGLNGHTHNFSATSSSAGEHRHSIYNTVSGRIHGGREVGGSSTIDEIKNHPYTSEDGIHSHTISGTTDGNSGNTSSATPAFTGKSGTTSGNSGATASTAPAFTGKSGTTGNTGSGNSVNIMPPYEVANCWKRTA